MTANCGGVEAWRSYRIIPQRSLYFPTPLNLSCQIHRGAVLN
ncbi:hypothetical protein [Oscillatoria sp. FACHB-1407]